MASTLQKPIMGRQLAKGAFGPARVAAPKRASLQVCLLDAIKQHCSWPHRCIQRTSLDAALVCS
jgi:hypothetical protein